MGMGATVGPMGIRVPRAGGLGLDCGPCGAAAAEVNTPGRMVPGELKNTRPQGLEKPLCYIVQILSGIMNLGDIARDPSSPFCYTHQRS